MSCQQSSRNKHLQHYDVTECVICADTYTDPRQLPCLHTFCLACIETYITQSSSQDTVACPLCRRQFSTSELTSLPKDRFIGKMLMVRRLTSQVANHLHCDVCGPDAPAASMYCVDCCQSLCKPCAVNHRQNSPCVGHELVKLRKRRLSRPDKFLTKLPAAPCHKHEDEWRDMFCVECLVTACRRCLADEHKSHRAGKVERLGDRLRDSIAADVDRMQQSVRRCRFEMDELRQTRDEFAIRCDEVSLAVSTAATHARAAIDDQEHRLLDDLSTAKNDRIRQLDNHIAAHDLQVKALDSFSRYCCEMKDKGGAGDVASASAALKRRAAELLEFDADRLTERTSSESLEVHFNDVEWLYRGNISLLGSISIGDQALGDELTLPSAPPLVQTQPSSTLLKVIDRRGRNSVCGIATDGLEVFIARNNSADIDVYDADTLERRRLIPIPGLRSLYGFGYDVWGFTLCRHNACLYVGYQGNVIRRLAVRRQRSRSSQSGSGTLPPPSPKDSEWAVPGEAKGLSVTVDRTVLVAIAGKCKLKELARQYLAENCGGGTGCYSELYRRTTVDSQALQSFLRRRLGRHDFDYICNCLIYQLFVSVSGFKQIDLAAYIESDDCKHALREYSSDGQVVREIDLPADVTEPQHAVQLGRHFVVSHAGSLHRVCVIDDSGRLETSYGRRRRSLGATELELKEPRDVAVDSHGRILVADKDNNRVVVLDQCLTQGRELLLPAVDGGLDGPWSLCLDPERDRCYVGEWDGGRVLVYDHISNVALR